MLLGWDVVGRIVATYQMNSDAFKDQDVPLSVVFVIADVGVGAKMVSGSLP